MKVAIHAFGDHESLMTNITLTSCYICHLTLTLSCIFHIFFIIQTGSSALSIYMHMYIATYMIKVR